jgi:hypothetical protein
MIDWDYERSRCWFPGGVKMTEREALIEKYRLYCAWHARRGHDSMKHYDTADLCAAQERAIRQLQEYLDPKGDACLIALVEDAAKRELEARASSTA